MGGGTMGVVLDAISRQNDANRALGNNAASRIRARLQLRLLQSADDDKSQLEDFACFSLCTGCGYLSETSKDICPSCGMLSWIDLRNHGYARALQQEENHARMEPPPTLAWGLRWGGALLAVIPLFVSMHWWPFQTLLFFWNSPPLLLLVVFSTMGFGATIGHTLRRPFSRKFLDLQNEPPTRWRGPVKTPNTKSPQTALHEGEPKTEKPLLLSPFTGRSCLAYRVRILFNNLNDARPPMWVLDEQKAVDFKIGDHAFCGDQILLQNPMHQINPMQQLPHEEQNSREQELSQFLRQRGLFWEDGDFTLYESILPPEGPCKATFHQKPSGAGPTVHSPSLMASPTPS